MNETATPPVKTNTQASITPTKTTRKPTVGSLWRKEGVTSDGRNYKFLTGYINVGSEKIRITVNKSKLKPEERTETSSDYYICLDDYVPKAKTTEAGKPEVEAEEPF